MKANELFKDKNKLLMGIPVILGLLFIYVFFIHAGQPEETQQKEDASAFFEPTAQESEKAGDKLEAYKRDQLEKQEQERIRKESDVKGSDFYFDLHNREEQYDERKLERIRRMQGDPYSEVMSGYGGGRQGRFAQQLDQQLDGLEDEEALNEIIREARKNARIRKDLDESERYRKEMYKRILQYDEDKKKKSAAQPSSPLLDSLEESKPIYVAENGKRMRKQQTAVPVSSTIEDTLRSGGILNLNSLAIALGEFAAPMGTGAALVILACGLVLWTQKDVHIGASASFLITCGLIAFFFPRQVGLADSTLFSSLLPRLQGVRDELHTGAMLFCAVFLLNEPYTCAHHRLGRILYGALVGIATMGFRYFGVYETGVCFALLAVNSVSALIDRTEERLYRLLHRLPSERKEAAE